MFNYLKNKFNCLSVDTPVGKFLSDKSFKYDVLHFMALYIKDHAIDGFFNYYSNKSSIEKYTVEKFTLNANADGNLNFMAETLSLLQYAKIIRDNDYGIFEIMSQKILDFICESMENSYIVQYMIAYYTFANDNLIDLYSLYVNTDSSLDKHSCLRAIYERLCEISPSIDELDTVWSKLYTKYPIMVLGLANEEFAISRELKIGKKYIDAFSLSANVNGTKTKPQFRKHNDYSAKFDLEYVQQFLRPIIVKGGK